MAKYKIIPSSRTIVQSPISIGHKAEKGVEAIEFDLTAWVETYGSGTLTVIMRRWGDAIPYPIALEIDEDNKATWTLSDTDTAKAGMAYAQLSYIVGETVVKKSDIYTFRVMDSLTGEGDPPEAYESWLEHLTHIAAEAMAEVLDIEGIVTDKTLTIDGGIADAKATGDALAGKVDAADYSTLSARVGANTIALAEKADRSTTYTKTEVDQMIEDVEVETDTTLEVAGAAADAAETGRQIGLLKADLDAYDTAISDINDTLKENLYTEESISLTPISSKKSWDSTGETAQLVDGGTAWFASPEISVAEGEKYNVFTNIKTGYGTVRPYIITDDNLSIIETGDDISGQGIMYVPVTIPEGGTKLLINRYGTGMALYKIVSKIPELDSALTDEGKAADAKATGDAISAVNTRVDTANANVSEMAEKLVSATLESETDVNYVTTEALSYTYIPFAFVSGKRYRVTAVWDEKGTPYPTSVGMAFAAYTTTTNSISSSYRVDTVIYSNNFDDQYVEFTATGNATYLSAQTRSSGTGATFDGTFKIYELEDAFEKLESAIEDVGAEVAGNRFTATDDVTVITSYSDVLALYDALVQTYPNYITKSALNTAQDGTVIYEYVFSTGDYNNRGGRRTYATAYKKPKLLLSTGVHGDEKGAITSLYMLMREICRGGVFSGLKEQVEIHVVPAVNPDGVDADTRNNANDVNINRNFDARWSISTGDAGSAPASEYETQAMQAWMTANNDALLYIDYHNSGYNDEISYFAVDKASSVSITNVLYKHWWDGISRIFEYWRTKRNLDLDSELIPSYVGKNVFTGTAIAYGYTVAGIPSTLIETQVRMPSDGTGNKYSSRVIGIGAESVGNALLGLFEYLNESVTAVTE